MACATEADTICHIKASGSGSPIKFLDLDDTIGQLKQEGGYIIIAFISLYLFNKGSTIL